MSLTTDPKDPCLKEGSKSEGQNNCYLVLSKEELEKGFVRPYRDSYVHVGRKVENEKGKIISLEEANENCESCHETFNKENGYVGFLEYSDPKSSAIGHYLKQDEFLAIKNQKSHIGGCGALTKMGSAIAETYARDPKFYGSTFCTGCNKHLPVEEFVWDDNSKETVGS